MMDDLPRSQASIRRRIPAGRKLRWLEESDLPVPGGEDSGLHHAAHAGVLGLGKGLRHPVVSAVEPVLLEPGKGPAAIRVEVALLLGQDFVKSLVDQRECIANTHSLARSIDNFGVTRVDRHPRPDGGLSEVHRSGVGALQVPQGGGEIGLECSYEFTARCPSSVGITGPAD